MPTKLGRTEIVLDGIAYLGIQSPLLKAHNLAHFINKFFEIELAKTIDFASYASGHCVMFPCYIHTSERDYRTYYLIGNKGTEPLFSSHPDVDFWFFVQCENRLNDHRFLLLKKKLYKDLAHVEQVFLVIPTEPEQLANFEDFEIDFSEYRTKLLQERKQNELQISR
jgi:hypothetical protein